MKKKDIFLLIALLSTAMLFIIFSPQAKSGAYEGLVLAQNTIIPSLLPLLIIFLLIMKTPCKDVLAKAFGFISNYIFALPEITLPAIFLGLIGGYPVGALLTCELLDNEEIDTKQAQKMMCFNFCGGCGFIITAVGCATLQNHRAGMILYISNLLSQVITGFALSLGSKRKSSGFYSFSSHNDTSHALTSSVESGVRAVLNLTAFIILFSAFGKIISLPDCIMPLMEITSGVCGKNSFTLPCLSAYLSFGGLCIHLQLLPSILKCKMNYLHFLLARIISSLLSYSITKLLLYLFPIASDVFSNTSNRVYEISSVNLALSVLMVIGCFVIILDINSKKRVLDR